MRLIFMILAVLLFSHCNSDKTSIRIRHEEYADIKASIKDNYSLYDSINYRTEKNIPCNYIINHLEQINPYYNI